MQYEDLHEAIVLVKRSGKFLMRKCKPGERWAGLWDFPRANIDKRSSQESISRSIRRQTGLVTEIGSLERTIKHAVTKFRIRLDCFQATKLTGRLKSKNSFDWKSASEIEDLPLSSTGRKFAKLYVKADKETGQ